MDVLITFLQRFGLATADVLFDSAIYVLFGFLIAGLLHVYLPTDRIVRFLRGRGFKSVAAAAALGAPLPLCSCGVVPSAVELRRNGASREATISFLVSTPETSVDSIALSWGLLGPVFAVVRPVVAVLSALVAGLMQFLWGGPERVDPQAIAAAEAGDCGCGSGGAGCGGSGPETTRGHRHEDHAQAAGARETIEDHCGVDHAGVRPGQRLAHGIRYSLVSLFDDLAFWFVIGVVLTGLITALVPDGLLARVMDQELVSILFAAALGIPLYMCASSSTPVAAALLAKGLNPGAALVFLLTGPATNAATLSVLARVFGRRFAAIYVTAIAGTAIASGLVFNRLYHVDPAALPVAVPGLEHGPAAWIKWMGVAGFLVLLATSFRRTRFRPGWQEMRRNAAAFVLMLRGPGRTGPA